MRVPKFFSVFSALTVATLLILAGGGFASPALARGDVRTITPHEAAQRRDVVVIDVREPYELGEELGYIEGAVNIPLGRILVAHGLEGKFDKDTAIVMVCRTGVRSARAAARAAELGFTNVVSLEGGMAAWNDAGLEIKRAKAQAKPAIQFDLIGLPCS